MTDDLVLQHLDRVWKLAERWPQRADLPPRVLPGSRLAADDALTGKARMSDAVDRSIAFARDYLDSVQTLLAAPGGLRLAAPYSLSRMAIENAAHALWHLDEDDQLERVERRLLAAASDVKSQAQANRDLGLTPNDLRDEQLEYLAGLAEAVGLDPVKFLKAKPAVWSEIVRAAASDPPLSGDRLVALWRVGSGFAHGQQWSLLTGADVASAGSPSEPSRHEVKANLEVIASLVMAAVMVTDKALLLRARHSTPLAPGA